MHDEDSDNSCYDDGKKLDEPKRKKRRVRRNLTPALMMAEGLSVPVSKDRFASIIEAHGFPTNWRGNKVVRQALVRMAVCGELAEDSGVVMEINWDNYVGGSHSHGVLVFRCSECSYVGERYYHAGTLSLVCAVCFFLAYISECDVVCAGKHFERIHVRKGKPSQRKRKYADVEKNARLQESNVAFVDTAAHVGVEEQQQLLILPPPRRMRVAKDLPSKQRRHAPVHTCDSNFSYASSTYSSDDGEENDGRYEEEWKVYKRGDAFSSSSSRGRRMGRRRKNI